jgi:phage repressor protein C with HTH and peptisase S24 domain
MDFNGIKSPSELARLTKIAQPTLYRWMVGDAREPRHSSLRPLADFFNVTLSDLLERDLSTGDEVALRAFVTARREVLMAVLTSEGEIKSLDLMDTRPALLAKATRDMFGLRVMNDSMDPALPAGSVVIVDPKRTFKVGDYVLAKEPQTGVPILRRIMQDGGYWYLKAENTTYGTTKLETEPKVLGVVVELQIVKKF